MSYTKLFLTLLLVALATLTVQAYYSDDQGVRFYELKKGNLRVNLTNFGARIVSLDVPDKFGNIADIVLGYDSIDAYQDDKYSFGAIVGRAENKLDKLKSYDGNGGGASFSNAIWKVLKHDKYGKIPFITFQYDRNDVEEEGNLIITATYLLRAKNKLQLTLYAEAKGEATWVDLGQNTYWNLGGHNSSGNVLHDHLRVLASKYRQLDENLVPTGRTLPIQKTPFDFKRFHPIQSKFRKLKYGYSVDYVLDHRADRSVKGDVTLAAVLRDKRSGRVMKVSTDQALLRFGTGDEVKNVRGKGGVLYQKNAGLVLSGRGHPDPLNVEGFPVITKQKPYNQTTLFQFLIKKR